MYNPSALRARYWLTAVALVLFWLLLSGHYTSLLLSLGGAAVLLVLWIVRRADHVDQTPVVLVPTWRLLRYLLWLARMVVESNIDVARRIWNPKLPISPRWERIPHRLDSPLKTTLYANSITLTPGTLTADIGEGYFLVHGLTEQGITDLRDGEMERRVEASGI